MKLDFSKRTIPEILSEFQDKNTFQWQNDIFDLMKKIDSKEEKVNFHYSREDNVYISNFEPRFVNKKKNTVI